MHRLKIRRFCLFAVAIGCGWAVIALSVVQAAGPPRGSEFKINAPVKVPAVIAVRVHHDMCPYCKKLAPQYGKLAQQENDESVLFLTLDLSSEQTQRQAALLVAALGLETLWTGDLSKIGTVTFVDGTSKETLSTFRALGTKEPLNTVLNEAIVSARE